MRTFWAGRRLINGLFPSRGIGFSVWLMKKRRSALMILRVRDRTAAGGNGFLVEIELLHSRLCFRPENLQAEYDLASLGEVESVSRPHGDPPKRQPQNRRMFWVLKITQTEAWLATTWEKSVRKICLCERWKHLQQCDFSS
jgi:hypothetical protein